MPRDSLETINQKAVKLCIGEGQAYDRVHLLSSQDGIVMNVKGTIPMNTKQVFGWALGPLFNFLSPYYYM